MPMVFNRSANMPEAGNFVKLGNAFLLVGTITFSGSYAAGGDTFTSGKSPEDLVKQVGAGRVLAVLGTLRGNAAEWDPVTKKLRLYASANTEVAAAAYNAALTASPVPVAILVR